MIEWIENNISTLLSLILIPLITWLFTKRHFQKKDLKDRDVNTESNQSEIVSKNLELYQRMLDDIEKRYEERIFKSDKEKEELEMIILELQTIIKDLEKTVKELQELNYEFDNKSKKFANEIINLKGILEEYEKNN